MSFGTKFDQNCRNLPCHQFRIMFKYLMFLIFPFFVVTGFAQDADSVFAVKKGSTLIIRHVLKNRETLSMLAQRYYTTLMSIESANEFDAKKKLSVGDYIYIPLTKDNYFIHIIK